MTHTLIDALPINPAQKQESQMFGKHHAAVFLIAILSGLSQATVTYTAPAGISVNVTQLSNGKWQVDIEKVSSSVSYTSTVAIFGSNQDDIESIRIIKGAFPQTQLSLDIRGGASNPIGSIEEIWVEDPDNMKIRIFDIDIAGDLGAASPSGANRIEVAQINDISIGGDWYADVVVDNKVDSELGSLVNVDVGGDWYSGGLWQNVKAIGTITISGSILASAMNPVEIWAGSASGSGSINTITATSIQNARIGSNTLGFANNS
jgi:hypothetical protein